MKSVKNKKKNKKKGFTLIELIVVIAILGVTSIIGVTAFGGISKKTKEKEYEAIKSSIRAAALNFNEATGLGTFYVQSLIDYGILSTDTNDGKIYNPIDNSEMNCYIVNINSNNIYELKENDSCSEDLYREATPIISYCKNECSKCSKASDWSTYQTTGKWTNVDALCFKASLPSSLSSLSILDYSWTYDQDYNFSSTSDKFELKFDGTKFSNRIFNGRFSLRLGLSDPTVKAVNANFEVNNDKTKPEVTATTGVNCGNGAKINVKATETGSGLSKVSFIDTSNTTHNNEITGSVFSKELVFDKIKTSGTYKVFAEDKSGNNSTTKQIYLDATEKTITLGIEVKNQNNVTLKSGDSSTTGVKFRFNNITWGDSSCAKEIKYYISDSDGTYDDSKGTVVPLNSVNNWIEDYKTKKGTFYIFYKATNTDNKSKTGKFQVVIVDDSKVSAPNIYKYELTNNFVSVMGFSEFDNFSYINNIATSWYKYSDNISIKVTLTYNNGESVTIQDGLQLGAERLLKFESNLKYTDTFVNVIIEDLSDHKISKIKFRVPRRGDVNGDGYVNQHDIDIANNYYYNHNIYLSNYQKKLLDVNCDGKYNENDAEDLKDNKIVTSCDLDQKVLLGLSITPVYSSGYVHIVSLKIALMESKDGTSWSKAPLVAKVEPYKVSYKNFTHQQYQYQYNNGSIDTTKSNYKTYSTQTPLSGYVFKAKDAGIITSSGEALTSNNNSVNVYIDKTPPTYSSKDPTPDDIYKMFVSAQCWQSGSDDDYSGGERHSNLWPGTYTNFAQKSIDNVRCTGKTGSNHYVSGVTEPIYLYIHYPVKVEVDNVNRVIVAHFCQFHDNMSYYFSYFNSTEFNNNELPYTDALSGLKEIKTYTIGNERCSHVNGKSYCGSSGSPTYWDFKQVAYDNANNLFMGYDVRLITHYYNWDESANTRKKTEYYNANYAFDCSTVNTGQQSQTVVIGEKLVYEDGEWKSAGTCRNNECTSARYGNGTFPRTDRVFAN